MSLLRCIAILTIFVFSILAINPVFAIKLHGDGHYTVNIGWGQVATVAWAYAQATDAADAGAYSVFAQVDSNWSDRWGNYQGAMWESVSASSTNPNPLVWHNSFIN